MLAAGKERPTNDASHLREEFSLANRCAEMADMERSSQPRIVASRHILLGTTAGKILLPNALKSGDVARLPVCNLKASRECFDAVVVLLVMEQERQRDSKGESGVHAEMKALNEASRSNDPIMTLGVTRDPCANCAGALSAAGVTVKVVKPQ